MIFITDTKIVKSPTIFYIKWGFYYAEIIVLYSSNRSKSIFLSSNISNDSLNISLDMLKINKQLLYLQFYPQKVNPPSFSRHLPLF